MIKIENENLEAIANEYKETLNKWLNIGSEKIKSGKSKGEPSDKFLFKMKYKKNRYQKMLAFVSEQFDDIITCKVDHFDEKIEEFSKEFSKDIDEYIEANKKKKGSSTSFGKFKATMESFYKNFFKAKYSGSDEKYKEYNNGTWLTSKLGVKVCPYCNRQYTFTIDTKNATTRPQFDHFRPKSKYPYLALSFYNLVPSCPTCNHIKGEKEIEINPYKDSFTNDDIKFILKPKEEKGMIGRGNYEVDFTKTNKNIETFGLKPLYNEHTDYIDEIIDKIQAYNSAYYDSLISSYSGLGKTGAEIDRFIWGTYLDEAEHCKRPLSKLTRDVLDQLGKK